MPRVSQKVPRTLGGETHKRENVDFCRSMGYLERGVYEIANNTGLNRGII
jgi:hypothetical protein